VAKVRPTVLQIIVQFRLRLKADHSPRSADLATKPIGKRSLMSADIQAGLASQILPQQVSDTLGLAFITKAPRSDRHMDGIPKVHGITSVWGLAGE
jgi:hypothetical protein